MMTVRRGALVAETADALSKLSLSVEQGDFIGGEEELVRRLGVSRPTLRQAAKIAENERLVDVRRGIKGGFYASRPNADDAIRILARFLRLRETKMAQVREVSHLLLDYAVEFACKCKDDALRARLQELADGMELNESRNALIEAEVEFLKIVAEMSGNPLVEAVMAVGYTFGLQEDQSDIYHEPEQRARARGLLRDVADAVLVSDVEIARVMMNRRKRYIDEWSEHEIEQELCDLSPTMD